MGLPPKRPAPFIAFAARFPELAQMWGLSAETEADGPLDDRTACLVKLAAAIGAMREGAVRASVRNAQGLGIEFADLEQVVVLVIGTLGMPAAAAAPGSVREPVLEE